MLQLHNKLHNVAVLSLRTGGIVAEALGPLVNPNNLKIEGFYCYDKRSKKQLMLLVQDIREILKEGFVVNDFEVLVEPEELVRLKKIIDLEFDLIGKQVVTISKDKVGKISDYATDFSTFYIHKLYVSQSIVKSLTGGNVTVDRTHINEITNSKIIIDDLIKPNAVGAAVGL